MFNHPTPFSFSNGICLMRGLSRKLAAPLRESRSRLRCDCSVRSARKQNKKLKEEDDLLFLASEAYGAAFASFDGEDHQDRKYFTALAQADLTDLCDTFDGQRYSPMKGSQGLRQSWLEADFDRQSTTGSRRRRLGNQQIEPLYDAQSELYMILG